MVSKGTTKGSTVQALSTFAERFALSKGHQQELITMETYEAMRSPRVGSFRWVYFRETS